MTQTILLVDDEPGIRAVARSYLEHAGFAVIEADNGRDGLALALSKKPSLIVLDLMLPDISGEEVCRLVRRQSKIPILMLTARVDEESQLHGFHVGADDYLTKPFSPRALVARVQAILRRINPEANTSQHQPLQALDGLLVVEPKKKEATLAGARLLLTPSEFSLLEVFLQHPGQTFSRSELASRALGPDFEGDERTVDAHIKNLRHKLGEQARDQQLIQTVFGFGYRFRDAANKEASG